jgi:hypothetical protein
MNDARGLVTGGLLATLFGCSEPAAPDTGRGGSDSGAGGSVGAAAGSTDSGGSVAEGGTGAGHSGAAAGGAPGQAGGGTELTGAALRDATHDECFTMCTKANQACPDYDIPVCFGTCQGQADGAFADNSCARELYEALRCINTLGTENFACDPNGVVFNGCELEQAAYSGC